MASKYKRFGTFIIFSFVLLVTTRFPIISGAQLTETCVAYVYLYPEIGESEIKSYFKNEPDYNVIYFNLSDAEYLKRFVDIAQSFQILSINILPTDTCLQCMLKQLSWEEIYIVYASPIIGFFHNGKLTAITIKTTTPSILDQASVYNNESQVKIFKDDGEYYLSDKTIEEKMEYLFSGNKGEVKISPASLLSPILMLAVADSINPCTFVVFSALLFLTLYYIGKRRTIATGLSFILAVFIIYFILGFALISILSVISNIISNIMKIMALIGLTIGVLNIAMSLKPRFRSLVPKTFREFIERRIKLSYSSPIASFSLGLVASLALLPCSSGPYIVGLGLLSLLKEPILPYLLLFLYNVVFVLPLIAILIAVLASSKLSHRIKIFRNTKKKPMELLSGILLVAVCLYLLVS